MKTADIEVAYVNHMGDDLSVVNAARVSFHKESEYEKNGKFGGTDTDISDKDAKLIKYLAKHKHFSPFNHTFITLRVKAPIFVARQLV
jgi:thymidylate synthase (FAD)